MNLLALIKTSALLLIIGVTEVNLKVQRTRYHENATPSANESLHKNSPIVKHDFPPRPAPGYLTEEVELSDESRLTSYLFSRYEKTGCVARPVTNSSKTMTIEFAIALIQILDFDETNQVLTTNVWKRYRWVDDILIWNPDDFGGISNVRLPSDKIWTPDIVLYNNADVQEKTHEELISVYSEGLVRWIPPAIYRSSCPIDMRNFPFDEQSCIFKFGSWTYDGTQLALVFYDALDDLDLREFIESSEWDVLSTSAEHHVRYYPCCGSEPYPDLTFYLTIKRRTAFYVYVLILPSVLLSSLTLVLFWIPPQRPDRTSLGMSLFSSFFVLLLILVQSSPPTSASISLLGVYYCINMVMIAVSTLVSAAVINMTYYLQRKSVPGVIKAVLLGSVANCLCAQADVILRDFDESSSAMMMNGRGGTNTQFNRYHVQNSHNVEWRMVASVIDRIFFLLYVLSIILSLIFVFPR